MINKTVYNNNELAQQIAEQFHLDKNIAKLLSAKGLANIDEVGKFLYPSLSNLSPLEHYVGLKEVSQRIKQAIENQQIVVIYGDYDCDGVCGASILYSYLISQGIETYYFLPNRHNDGYGINIKSLEMIAENYLPDLIISVDCGITSCEEVEYAQEVLGVDIIITDHHEPTAELPQCLIFNPKLSDNNVVYTHLCGAGVALRIIESIAGLDESKKYYDIAALATIADVVPLTGDNRIIVHFGLKSINKGYRKGLKMLVDSCIKDEVKSSDIAFKIAPRINAVGRIDDANKVVELMVSNDHFLLQCLVDEINKANDIRQKMTSDLEEFCYEKLVGYDFENLPIIVMYNAYWDEGVLGICAARIVGKFNRPVILLTKSKEGNIKGSGRSILGVNLHKCVHACSDLLDRFGGHTMACGLSLKVENLDDFVTKINDFFKQNYSNDLLKSTIRYDFDMNEIENIDVFTQQLQMLQPFGENNCEPKIMLDCTKQNFVSFGNNHIKSKESNYEIIGFGMSKHLAFLNGQDRKKLLCHISRNLYNNIWTAQFVISRMITDDIKENDYYYFVSQSVWDNSSIYKPTVIDIEQIEQFSGTYGVCFVSYDVDIAMNFANNHSDLQICNRVLNDYSPRNTLIFNPHIDTDLSYFSKIIFLDMPLSLGVIDNMIINKNAQVICVNNLKCIENCSNYLEEYNNIGKMYMAIKSMLKIKQYKQPYNLFWDLQKGMQLNYNVFIVSWCIFVELGIIKIDSNEYFYIDESVQSKITNSKLYNQLSEAKNGR